VFFWKDVVRPLGWFAFWGALGAALIHYVTIGPKNIPRDDDEEEA
jgi:formate dehydrogenase iron-sulfur subunit